MEAMDGMGTFKSIKTTKGFLSQVQAEKVVFAVILVLYMDKLMSLFPNYLI